MRALVLLVMVFLLPMPWGHTHQHHFAHSPTGLYQAHVLLYHFGGDDAEPDDCDWHLHWRISGLNGPECLRCQAEIVSQAPTTQSLAPLADCVSPLWEIAEAGGPSAAAAVEHVPIALCVGKSLLFRLCVLRI